MATVRRKKKAVKKKARGDIVLKPTPLTLATELSEVSDNISDYTIWLYGKIKIGKTTLASLFPKAHFVLTEQGTKSLRVLSRYANNWKEFKKYLEMLRKADMSYDNVVIDIVEIAYEYCVKYILDVNGLLEIPDGDYGRTSYKIRKEFLDGLTISTTDPNKGCICISHAVSSTRKTLEGDEVEDVHPNLSGKPLEMLAGLFDIVAYYTYRNGRRVLQLQGDDYTMAGHRLQGRFLHPSTGEAIKFIDMGTSPEEGYDNFIKAFNNEYVPPAVKKKGVKRKVKRSSR